MHLSHMNINMSAYTFAGGKLLDTPFEPSPVKVVWMCTPYTLFDNVSAPLLFLKGDEEVNFNKLAIQLNH